MFIENFVRQRETHLNRIHCPNWFSILAAICFLTATTAARTSVTGGGLEGTVSDFTGGRISGVKVQLTETATGRTRDEETNSQGSFRAAEIPVSAYEVVATHPGFASYHPRSVLLQGGSMVHLNVMLQSATSLQDASQPEEAVHVPGSKVVQPQSSGSIAGTIRDAHGAVVPDVRVMLIGLNNAVEQVVSADSKGAFTFDELAPGTYRVKIAAAAGLEPLVSDEVVLGAGERHELTIIGTRIPTTSTTVHVTATLNQVAQAQVQEQEKQRVLGFLPNYYSSYIWDAAPMTPKLKFKLSLRSTTDPVTFLVAAGLAGVEQKHNTFPGYGQGAEGYAKRFGAAYADTMVSKMVSRAILPTVLHQDPRYFYRGSGSIRSRIFYALAAAVICRGDNGRLQPNYSQVLGNFAASGISNLYRAPGDRTASLTFRNGLIMTGSGAVENLLREFVSRKLTSNVPAFANGKP